MKILVINTVRFKLNGISTVIMNYYRAMDKTNLQMDFIAIDEPIEEYKKLFERYGVKYFVIKKDNIFTYFIELTKVAKKETYDIAHVHGNSANMVVELLACWRAGIKVRIAHCHNTSSLHPIMHRLFYPLFSLLCTNRFACGNAAGKWLFHNLPFVEIKNGIDLHKYSYDEDVRKEYRNKINASNKFVIGHIGNFIEQKNHTFLLDVFAQLIKEQNQCVLVMISDGNLLNPMKKKAHELGIDDYILFLGKTMEVCNYLQAMDIFILPSLYEGFPVVLVEAQAAGLPCIVSDTVSKEADLTDSIKFVEINDQKKWVEEINKTIQQLDSKNRSEIAVEWQNLIRDKGYDINCNANWMLSLYKSFLLNDD